MSAFAAGPVSDDAPHHGAEGSAVDAQARLAAGGLVAEFADEEAIDCSLQRQPAFTCTASQTERSDAAALEAGLPVEFVDGVDLPC